MLGVDKLGVSLHRLRYVILCSSGGTEGDSEPCARNACCFMPSICWLWLIIRNEYTMSGPDLI